MANQGERLKEFCDKNGISLDGGKMFVSFRETGTVACEVTVQGKDISTNQPPAELVSLARNNLAKTPWVGRLVNSQAPDFKKLLSNRKAIWNGHQLARLFWVAYAPSLLPGAEKREKLQFQWGQDLFVSKDGGFWRKIMKDMIAPPPPPETGRGKFKVLVHGESVGIEFTSSDFKAKDRRAFELQSIIDIALERGIPDGTAQMLTGPNSKPTAGPSHGIRSCKPWTGTSLAELATATGNGATATHRLFLRLDGADEEMCLELINAFESARTARPQGPWERLAEFALKHGWTSHAAIRLSCNVILEGVPGTGKTHALKQLGEKMANSQTIAAGRFATVMHPATSYEDFVEGLRPGAPKMALSGGMKTVTLSMSPEVEPISVPLDPPLDLFSDSAPLWFFESPTRSSSSGFSIHDGFFVAACAAAVRNPSTPYVVLLDELNRCNIPKVMGDLITTMEVSKRAKWVAKENGEYWDLSSAQVVTLPYSKRQFFVPDNLTIVGTMNTTDRSVAPMDAALRRRFVFVRVEPEFSPFTSKPAFAGALRCIVSLNSALNTYLGADAMLGHSYFYDMEREIDACGDAAKVTEFYFDKVIFPMVVDTLVNNGCLAELNEANGAKADAPAAVFRRALETVASLEFSGRGITQTLKLSLL